MSFNFLTGSINSEVLNGTNEADFIKTLEGNDTVYAGDGNDIIDSGAGDDTVIGGNGDDCTEGQDGNDLIEDGLGKDTLLGGNGHDTLIAGEDDDTLAGGDGNDILRGDGGNDILYGEAGDDCMLGGDGNDTLLGGDGNDVLGRGNGTDELNGDLGDDTVVGGAGDDVINGGAGNDVLYGDRYISRTSTVGENLVTNGSFEDYTVSYNGCYQSKTIKGWTTNYASGIDIKKNNYYNSASNGNTWLELEGYGNSSISQQIKTEAGKKYQVSFDYKGHARGSAYNNKIEVYWNGELIDTIAEKGSRYGSYYSKGSNNWKTYTYTLEAGDGDLTGLTFKAVGCSYRVGGQLDNVEVREVYQDPLANKLGTEKVIGNDRLDGGEGNDIIYGGAGNDTLFGGAGKDTLSGADKIDAGYDQEDRLNGGLGADTFVLGNSDRGYYNSQGWTDCVIIEDFDRHEDIVQLNGSRDRYWLGHSSNGNSYLYEYTDRGWDGVAMFENVRLDNSHLHSGAFEYV